MDEIREIMKDLPCELVSMKEAGAALDIEETGTTYAENALIKAGAVYDALRAKGMEGFFVLADDSGFEVDFLDKQPGVYSSRFMGEDTPYTIKNAAILEKLAGVPDEKRSARFCCAVAIIYPDGKRETVFATYEGSVAYEAKGTNGFGYDPIFLVPGYNMTDAELPIEVKNTIGHRAKALALAKEKLKNFS